LGESFNSLDPVNRLELETAVAFADGYFALTRPITNSFVLIAPHPNLEGYPILLNPAQDLYEAKVDQLGAGVIPDLVPYQVSKLLVDAPELPLGYDLGPSSYTLFPSYRSGTLIRVGSAATVFLRGTLVNAECEAIGLETFEVIALDNPDWEPITFFTNRVGRFAAPSFQPGQYEIRQLGQPAITTQFTIPESTTGLYNLGTLSLPKQANCDNFQLK
jgi:outer membrane usher protein